MAFIRSRAPWLTVAAASILALAGCSQGSDSSSASVPRSGEGTSATSAKGDLAIPADADKETRRQYILQNALAACMRGKGFTYTPHVQQEGQALNDVDGKDYDAAKKYREKYGFGIYAGAVYRNDPNVFGSEAFNKKDANPDVKYLSTLTEAQKKAYDKALGGISLGSSHSMKVTGCSKEAQEKAYGHDKSQAEIDRQAAETKERSQAAKQALNGDAELIRLAQKFASCLTKQGITVTTTQPTAIGDMVKFQVSAQEPSNGVLSLSKSEATAKLSREIDIAKKDLACGRDFRAAYFPKLAKHPFEDEAG